MTQVEKIILKYYDPKKRNYNAHNWEKCGTIIYNLIRDKEQEIRDKNFPYSEQCRRITEMTAKIENEYEAFFAQYNINGIKAGYDWINGNDKLKKLINS
jgi:hypothetical protein